MKFIGNNVLVPDNLKELELLAILNDPAVNYYVQDGLKFISLTLF